MKERRVVQNLSVVYSTPPEQLEKIPVWVKALIEKHPRLRFERCHFFKYGASALEYETVFWVTTPDYNTFMDLQQKVLVDIIVKFQEEDVKLSLPTQSLKVDTLNVSMNPEATA